MKRSTWYKIAIPPLIGGLFAITAAVIDKNPGSPDTAPNSTSTAHAEIPSTARSASSPRHTATSGPIRTESPPQHVSSRPTAQPASVPILRPVNQQGYQFVWHGTITIGVAGILFTPDGPQEGGGNGYDLAYLGQGNWQTGGPLTYWKRSVAPGPESCNNAGSTAISVDGLPRVGDRYCYEAGGQPAYAYMQVTKVTDAGVTVVGWLWWGRV
jgi:hypothetical protein